MAAGAALALLLVTFVRLRPDAPPSASAQDRLASGAAIAGPPQPIAQAGAAPAPLPSAAEPDELDRVPARARVPASKPSAAPRGAASPPASSAATRKSLLDKRH